VENVKSFLAGDPIHVVNRPAMGSTTLSDG
jgi:hypothetical protein